MFGFDKPEYGSQERFHARVNMFEQAKLTKIGHHFWWVIHNCVAHPLIGLVPIKTFFDLHDWTSGKINAGSLAEYESWKASSRGDKNE